MSIFLSLAACSSQWDSSLLIGEWKSTSWTIVDIAKEVEGKMDFVFKSNERYELDYGSKIEKGKYWIFGDFLHTVEDGKNEKKVKIISLSSESFIFEMNRAGTIERVVLQKN